MTDMTVATPSVQTPVPKPAGGARVVRRTITLTPEIDARIQKEVEREGRHYSTIIKRALAAYFGVRGRG